MPNAAALRSLEAQLDDPTLDNETRVFTLDALLSRIVYTDPRRARELLATQDELLRRLDYADYRLNYYLQLGALESQGYRFAEAERALSSAVTLVDRIGDHSTKVETYLDYVGVLTNLDRMEEASDFFDRCRRILEAVPDERLQARAFCRHGFLYLNFYSYAKATLKFREADRLLEGGTFELTAKDHYFYSLVHSGIGTVAMQSRNPDTAAAAFRRAINRCQEQHLSGRLAWHQLNLGKMFIENHHHEEASGYFRAVIDSQANGSTAALAAAYANLGSCYLNLARNHDEANDLFDRAESLYRSLDTPDRNTQLANIAFMRAGLLHGRGDLVATIRQLNRALEIADVDRSDANPPLLDLTALIYQALADCHAALEDFRSAYIHQGNYDYYQDEYQKMVDLTNQRRFEAQFEAEARERDTEALRLRASQLQLRALRAQMNPHFMYNALNSIQSFISTNNTAVASQYLAKFASLMRQSLEYTSREFISLEEEVRFLEDYLDINRNLRFEGQLHYEVRVDDELEEDIMGIPSMILQPYVENAIEHGLRGQPEGHIWVTFQPRDEESIFATVTDNGIGRAKVREMQARDDMRPYHQSRGTEITRSRLDLLSNSSATEKVNIVDLYDEEGRATGTRIEVIIPTSDLLPRRMH